MILGFLAIGMNFAEVDFCVFIFLSFYLLLAFEIFIFWDLEVFIMLLQQNQQINMRFDSLRTEKKDKIDKEAA